MKTDIKLLILLTHTLYLIQFVSSHYYEPITYYQSPNQRDYNEYEDTEDYDVEPRHHSHRSSNGRRRYYEREYTQSNDCDEQMQYCSCDKCSVPTLCCQTYCISCSYMSGQTNLMYVPYPYQLIVSGQESNTTEITLSTTITTEKPTAVVKVTSSSDNALRNAVDLEVPVVRTLLKLKNGNNKYLLTSLRRTKPTWEPKYGIVPIPDNLAEKLMSQLREVKEFKYRQDRE